MLAIVIFLFGNLREKSPDPCLDRLLLLFWAHYIEDDPLYFAQVALGGYRKQRRGCCQLHRRGRIFANVKGKVVKPVTLILGRFSIDLGSYFKDMQ